MRQGAAGYLLVASHQPAGAGARVYPYLLRGATIIKANQVWAADITYLPIARGFRYLVAVMDWHSRYVLVWRLSNALEVGLCAEALEEALTQGQPRVFNTGRVASSPDGSSPRSCRTGMCGSARTGRGRYQDNIFVERLCRGRLIFV